MATDPLTVGLAVGVTCVVLIVIIVVVVYFIFCKSKAKVSSDKKASQSFSPYQNTQDQIVQSPGQMSLQTPPLTPPITYVPPQVNPYSYYNSYISRAADYRAQLPTSQWYPRPYRALGATEDSSSTQVIQPGVLSLGDKPVPLYTASQNGGASTESNAFILPKLEPFILPLSKNELEIPKDTFDKFILPTDQEAIIDEFGSEDFILPKIDLTGKKNDLAYQPQVGPEAPGESSLAIEQTVTVSPRSSYNPYAPVVYDPYSSYQPYGPPATSSPKTQTPTVQAGPDRTAEAKNQQRPDETNNSQPIYYYVTMNEAKPNEQQQQQQQIAESAEPAKQPTAQFHVTVDSTGASMPTTVYPPTAQSVSNDGQQSAPTASYQGYAIYQQTSCQTNPENAEQMSCQSTKKAYHLEAVPGANQPDQLVWVADQPQQQQPALLQLQQ